MLLLISIAESGPSNDLEILKVPVGSTISHTRVNRAAVHKNFWETGHIVMRHVDSALTGILTQDENAEYLKFLVSKDDGKSWTTTELKGVGAIGQPAMDANEFGTYVAYVAKDSEGQTGHVMRLDNPMGRPIARNTPALTPPAANVQYSSIAASRLGLKSVAYGWFDPASGAISVGYSSDGMAFPPTKVIAKDKQALFGPAVSIFGKYMVVTYPTTNPLIAPTGSKGGAYVAWLESDDGGKTWSQPRALFGKTESQFPSLSVTPSGGGKASSLRLTGLRADDSGSHSQALVWVAGTISTSRVFVTSTLSYRLPGEGSDKFSTVGVVSSKLPRKGGAWTHVAANVRPKSGVEREAGRLEEFHQYSALPGTPLRVVSFVDRNSQGEDSIVAVISTDNAKHFSETVRFRASDIGLAADTRLALRSSQCLWRDPDGTVSLDVFVTPDSGSSGEVTHAKVPIGIRLKGGEIVTASNW